ncbi:MAG: elongation factor Ts [Alphaproteobacteria bacterium]|nr:elongation factor Ts [Alphaproteobacteria bacterium]
MSTITAAMVKELRDRTGAGMMDCKKALSESAGDVENAADWLRKKGLAAASKKASRVAAEGLVGASTSGNKGALVEVNAETDFIARNDDFQSFVSNVAKIAVNSGADLDSLKAAAYPGTSNTCEAQLTHLIATIGENMNMRRCDVLEVSNGLVASYIHNQVADSIGKIGVLVALESAANSSKLNDLGRQIAMHIAATNPQASFIEDMDPQAVAKERAVHEDMAKASGKPAEFLDKMIEGRMRKFYEQVVLTEQEFVMNPEKRVKDIIQDAAKELGSEIKLKGFIRYALGEGIEKQETDFAAEVAAQLSK